MEKKTEKKIPKMQESQVVTEKRNTSSGLSGITFAIVALSLVMASAVVLGVTGAFFTNTQNVTGSITLGDPVTIQITQGGSSVSSLTFSGNAMPGTVYDQQISISAPANTSTALIRAKVVITNTDTASSNVTSTVADGWTTLQTDGYYYYNGALSAGNSIDFIDSIEIPTTLTNADAGKTFAVSVIVEAIQQANGAASSVWSTAPTTWKTTYASAS